MSKIIAELEKEQFDKLAATKTGEIGHGHAH